MFNIDIVCVFEHPGDVNNGKAVGPDAKYVIKIVSASLCANQRMTLTRFTSQICEDAVYFVGHNVQISLLFQEPHENGPLFVELSYYHRCGQEDDSKGYRIVQTT